MALVRVFGINTTSDRKVEEFKEGLLKYGIGVVKVANANVTTLLASSTPKYKVMGVIKEQTFLYKRGTQIFADKTNLELVEHLSVLSLKYYKDTNNLIEKIFEHRTIGYIDLSKKKDTDKKYDWDDIFVIDNCHLSYLELSQCSIKISSRDQNLSEVLKLLVYYKQSIDLAHNPQHYITPVDFNRTLLKYVQAVPEFNTESSKKYGFTNILHIITNQGAFFKSAPTRRIKIYWCPGLNAGIPLTPKPKDAKHELTFQMHDFGHQLIPDLVFDGIDTKLHKTVYIIYRLMSEAITLVMADMIFVTTMVESGFKYESVEQRRIYPIFQEILKKMPNFSESLSLNMYRLLCGSCKYCFYKDTAIWKDMMKNTEVLNQFSGKYDKYFMEDFRWTDANYKDMASHKEYFVKWWQSVKSWRALGHNIELESISEFIAANNLKDSMTNDDLINVIFNCIYDKYLEKIFISKIELLSPQKQLQNSFIRYMMGQSNIFFKYGFFNQSEYYFKAVEGSLILSKMNNNFSIDTVNSIRQFYENYLEKLVSVSLISKDDARNYAQCYPLFAPCFVDYDHMNPDVTLDAFVQTIIGV